MPGITAATWLAITWRTCSSVATVMSDPIVVSVISGDLAQRQQLAGGAGHVPLVPPQVDLTLGDRVESGQVVRQQPLVVGEAQCGALVESFAQAGSGHRRGGAGA